MDFESIKTITDRYRHRSIEELEEQHFSFMHLVVELNKDYHDNCDKNTCYACVGED